MTSGRGAGDAWERAYLRFESPREETKKFLRRLGRLGVSNWPAGGRVVELFCGRGSGLAALVQAGFHRVSGVDLSVSLAFRFAGREGFVVADGRHLPYADGSHDVAIVQGGLHHLARLPDDLVQTLREASRILADDGRFVVVEPWLTPFLRLVHALCRRPWVRRVSGRMDALQTMIEHEKLTYEQWLAAPGSILRLLQESFEPELCFTSLGKLYFVGRKRRRRMTL